MQGMLQVFNSRMEPIQTHEEYPKYARSETKPVVRGRHIIDNGVISDQPCSTCVELKQDCYRWEGAYGKCAYCTSKDKKQSLCHLPGQEASPAPERRKRRKITGNIHAPGGDAASNADTMMSGTFVSGTFASGTVPFSAVPMSATRSVRKRARSPEPASAMPGIINPRIVLTAASEAGSQATLERVTALENQVCSLEGKVMELLVKLEEVSSCVSTTSTPRAQAAAGASPTISNITFEDLQAQHLADAPPPAGVATTVRRATREWVLEGPKTPELPDASSPIQIATSEQVSEPKLPDASSPMQVATSIKVEEPDTPHASSPMYVATRERVEEPETPHALSPMHVATSERVEEPETSPTLGHTVEHPEGYRPVNCSCVTSGSSETDAVLPRGANARGETDSL